MNKSDTKNLKVQLTISLFPLYKKCFYTFPVKQFYAHMWLHNFHIRA